MDKEVLIHVRGLQTIDADGDQEPVEISAMEVTTCVMKRLWRILQSLRSIT